MSTLTHRIWMDEALAEARAAEAHDDVPVGAVVVRDGQIIARAHNERERRQDPTAHAEMLALRAAAEVVGSWRLERCVLYVTLEPCAMCAGAVVLARVPMLVYGASDPKAGAVGSLMDLARHERLNHSATVVSGIRADECAGVLTRFFHRRRRATAATPGVDRR
ncbi:MAG TPA: tRNA adenosine(34) deaminase TadA [Euzebyales bacterium]|nr:tRNA adenosine(34) deaminase TadA [Euzebyales bacterium]